MLINMHVFVLLKAVHSQKGVFLREIRTLILYLANLFAVPSTSYDFVYSRLHAAALQADQVVA